MLLFQKRFHAGLVDGSITITIRQWDKPRVKPGGRYRVHPIGVVEVDAVERTTVGALKEADARAAGFRTLTELHAYLAEVAKARFTSSLQVFRVTLHYGGDGDRVPEALDDLLDAATIEHLRERLARLDRDTPWTRRVLTLIARHPRIAASKLAAKLKRETEPFKIDVRKLKRLGLTQSFEVGYEVSPRGRAFLAADAGSQRVERQRRSK